MKSDNLLAKYLNGTTTIDEEKRLQAKMNQTNDPFFKLLTTGKVFTTRNPAIETKVMQKIKRAQKREHRKMYAITSIAASFLILLSTLFIYKLNQEYQTKLQVEALFSSPEKVNTLSEGIDKLNHAFRATSQIITFDELNNKMNNVTSQIQFNTTTKYLPTVPNDTIINNSKK